MPVADLVDIRQRLRSLGITPTPQRVAIAEVLFASHQHVTADGVFEKVNLKQTETGVSRATVYNSLGLFVKHGLLREIFIDASGTFYDTNIHPHHHFYNLDTGQLIDMEERLARLILESSLPDNTVVEDIEITIRVRNQKQ